MLEEILDTMQLLCYDESLSCVRLFATPWTAARQAPLSVGILQERLQEWVAMPSSRGSSQPRDGNQVSSFAGQFFTDYPLQYSSLENSRDEGAW